MLGRLGITCSRQVTTLPRRARATAGGGKIARQNILRKLHHLYERTARSDLRAVVLYVTQVGESFFVQ
jgi:hypothetical protein